MSRSATKPPPVRTNQPTTTAAPTQPSSHTASLQAAQALAAAAKSFAATQVAPVTNQASRSPSSTGSHTSKSLSSPLLPATTASHALLPYALLSKEEQKVFQTKFRTAQKSPQLVEIQIKALDGLIAFLKQKRANAQRTIQEALDEIKQIEKDQAMIHVKLDPLADRIHQNNLRRQELLSTKGATDEQMNEMMNLASKTASKTQHSIDLFKAKQLKADMCFARNLPLGVELLGQQKSPTAATTKATKTKTFK